MEQKYDWHLTEMLHSPKGRGDPFAAAVRATRMPMIITDPAEHDNPIVFVNEAFQKLSGYARDEIVGRNCRFMQGPETDQGTVAELRRAISQGEDIDVEILNYRKDGSTFWNALYLSPVRDDEGVIRYFFASQLDVTDRVQIRMQLAQRKDEVEREVAIRTAALDQALQDKTLLLHEVDHRVKNNLNMIGSLLRLQARTIPDKKVAVKLNEMLERVDALSTVHRRLYQSEDVSRFDVGAFLTTLLRDVVVASGRQDLRIEQHVEPLVVASDRAAPIGLVLNETLTNALKHAFADGRPGTLKVSARREGDCATIRIEDDGPGMGTGKPAEGLGHVLVTRLSRQAKVEVKYLSADPGMAVCLRFPLED